MTTNAAGTNPFEAAGLDNASFEELLDADDASDFEEADADADVAFDDASAGDSSAEVKKYAVNRAGFAGGSNS